MRIAPHEERVFSLDAALSRDARAASRWRAFQGNYSQRDVMQEVRSKLRKLPDLRVSVRNLPSFNIGGGNFDIDFSILGPELEELARYAERAARRARRSSAASSTPTPRSSSTSPSCAWRSTASAPPTSACAPRTSPRRCA